MVCAIARRQELSCSRYGCASIWELLELCHRVCRLATKYSGKFRTDWIFTSHSLEVFVGQCKRARSQLCERRKAVTTGKVGTSCQ
jgi:hypothetical protein